MVKSYNDLRVWQEAMTLAECAYRFTAQFPRDELFGLTSQIRHAAVSIPANIAEGYGRGSSRSNLQFLKIARGSLRELETHVVLSRRLGIATDPEALGCLALAENVGRMLFGLITSIEAKSKT